MVLKNSLLSRRKAVCCKEALAVKKNNNGKGDDG